MVVAVERFDFIEFLRLAIADSEGNSRSKITRSVVLGELGLLSEWPKMWAGLLVTHIAFERIAKITPAEAVFEKSSKCLPDQVQWRRCIGQKPGKVEFSTGAIRSADFYRLRNHIAGVIDRAMIKNNFRPSQKNGPTIRIAKKLAELVLLGHLFGKGMCAHCGGVGKHEVYEDGESAGINNCEHCNASGKIPYTINEKIKLMDLILSKSGYTERYAQYELIAESMVAQWNITIGQRLQRSFYDEQKVT